MSVRLSCCSEGYSSGTAGDAGGGVLFSGRYLVRNSPRTMGTVVVVVVKRILLATSPRFFMTRSLVISVLRLRLCLVRRVEVVRWNALIVRTGKCVRG